MRRTGCCCRGNLCTEHVAPATVGGEALQWRGIVFPAAYYRMGVIGGPISTWFNVKKLETGTKGRVCCGLRRNAGERPRRSLSTMLQCLMALRRSRLWQRRRSGRARNGWAACDSDKESAVHVFFLAHNPRGGQVREPWICRCWTDMPRRYEGGYGTDSL